ncbi:MAG: winged helix DNA-binding domain-containing protein [Rhodoglobus sp.]
MGLNREIAALRLSAQRIAEPDFTSAGDVVRWMFAMQAQDFPGVKWSVGLRFPGSTDAAVERAIASRELVRSWPMRGTLHLIAGEDLGWTLALTGPRLVQGTTTRRAQLGISNEDLVVVRSVAEQALAGGTLERGELLAAFERAGQPTGAQRGYHLLLHLAITRVIVFGPVAGKQHTFALLDEWVPNARALDREESLGEFALRYFTSHGPATERDFAWWASLTLTEARTAIAVAGVRLERREIDGIVYRLAHGLEPARDAVHLLPGFDEFLLGYQDRSAALPQEYADRIVPGNNGVFQPTIVSNGRVVGTWRRTEKAKAVLVEPQSFDVPTKKTTAGVASAATRYGRFLQKPVSVPG